MDATVQHCKEGPAPSADWIRGIKGSLKADYIALIAGLVNSCPDACSDVKPVLNKASQVILQHKPNQGGQVKYVSTEDTTYVYLDIFSHSEYMLNQLLLGSFEEEHCIDAIVVSIVDLLVKMENTIGVQHSGSFVLHNVIENGRGDIEGAVDILLQRKINQDIPDSHGFYPLHHVSLRLKEDGKLIPVLTSILDSSANVNVTNKGEFTPLHYLAAGGKEEVTEAVSILLERDADPNVKDAEDFLPIHYTCGRELNGKFGNITPQRINILQLLVQKGSRVNERGGETSLTPLHCCVLSTGEVQKAVEYLLLQKANPNKASRQKLCPIHIVCDAKQRSTLSPDLADLAQVTQQEQKVSFKYFQNLLRGILEEAAEDVVGKPSDIDTSLLDLLIKNGADVNIRGPKKKKVPTATLR